MSGKAKITGYDELAAADLATGDMIEIVDVSESAAADKNKKFALKPYVESRYGVVTIKQYTTIAADQTLVELAANEVIDKIEITSITGTAITNILLKVGAIDLHSAFSLTALKYTVVFPSTIIQPFDAVKNLTVAADAWTTGSVTISAHIKTI